MQDSTTSLGKGPAHRISNEWQQQAELLAHLSQFSQNLLCVVAPAKFGKTSFLQYFMSLPHAGLKKHALLETPESVEKLMHTVAKTFQLPWTQDQTQSMNPVTHDDERTWVLLVDDADKLSTDCLLALLKLLRFDVTPKRQLHLILFGQPELEQYLGQPEFQELLQGRCHTMELALNQSTESATTTQRHLQLDETKLMDDQSLVGKNIPLSHGAHAPEPMAVHQSPPTAVSSTLRGKTLRQYFFHPISFGALAGIGLGIIYLMLNPLDDVEWQSPLTHADQLAEATYQSERNALTHPPKLKVEVVSQQADEEGLDDTELEDAQIPLAEQVPQLPQEQTQPMAALTQPRVERQTTAQREMVETVQKVASAKKNRFALTAEEKYLLDTKESHYTLQLMGGTNQASLKQFIQDHQLEDVARIYRKEVGGKSWYVVVLGNYADSTAAHDAVLKLPDTVKQQVKPWVRRMGSIQTEIKDARS